MTNPAVIDENARLAALAACAVMDTPREALFDNIVFTASQLFRAPMAVIALVGESRVWVKASTGPLPQEWSRGASICNHILSSSQVTVIEDATADSRFAALPQVAGDPRIRFVAGAPLTGPSGQYIGVMTVFDRLTRTISDRQRAQLLQLAAEAGELLRMRVPNLDLNLSA